MNASESTRSLQPTVEDLNRDPPDFPRRPPVDYLPSPKQIREECRRIRQGWSEDEHWRRAGYHFGKPVWEVRRYCTPPDLK
jgi:hypothetical protein